MRRLLSSPRRRRRLYWGSGAIVAAGCALAIGLLYPNTGREEATFRPGKPQVTHEEPRQSPLPRSDLIASRNIVDQFVLSAVLRQHLERSYGIVTSQLRDGMKLAEWKKGAIPVAWFPAKDFAFAKSKLRYSYPNFARYDVLIWARPRSETGSTSFSLEMRAVGKGQQRHWLVDYFQPLGGGLSMPANAARNPLAVRPQATVSGGSELGVGWVLVPLSVLSLIVIIPGGLVVRGWRRNRRVDREYVKTLPPLRQPPS